MNAPATVAATQQQPNAPKNLADWVQVTMQINKTVPDGKGGNEYVEVGKLIVPVPTLESFGIQADRRPRSEADGDPTEGEEEIPLYADKYLDWLYYSAVVQACKAKARNKLVPKTADLKDGAVVASTLDELVAEGERVGNAAWMKLIAECSKAFTAWFAGLGKSAAATAMATTLFRKREALAVQPSGIKEKMAGYLSQFAETLESADAERYAKYLLSVEEACSTTTAEDF